MTLVGYSHVETEPVRRSERVSKISTRLSCALGTYSRLERPSTRGVHGNFPVGSAATRRSEGSAKTTTFASPSLVTNKRPAFGSTAAPIGNASLEPVPID